MFYDMKNAWGFCLDKKSEMKVLSEYKPFLKVQSLENRPLIGFIFDERPRSKKTFFINEKAGLFRDFEDVSFLNKNHDVSQKKRIFGKIEQEKDVPIENVQIVNTAYSNWKELFKNRWPSTWRVHVIGLGDVGGTLLSGLRLLGAGHIESLGIYDPNEEKCSRWHMELNQIVNPLCKEAPIVHKLDFDDIFDCDLFVFSASRFVPSVSETVIDPRMVQRQANGEIIKLYASQARAKKFKGIFAVVSDPVDLLCQDVFWYSNQSPTGGFDGMGLRPEQIRGYGLGVMYARACYYGMKENIPFLDGRVYGPHGKGLVVANSLEDYDENLSKKLTEKTISANLDIRKVGYKPFVAPALSSGAISLINTIKGNWNDSAVMLDGVYFGCRNRIGPQGTSLERVYMDSKLEKRLIKAVKGLKAHEFS